MFRTWPCHWALFWSKAWRFPYHLPKWYPGSSLRTWAKHVDAVEWPESKSVGFTVREPDCRTAYLQVETIRESIMTGEVSVCNDNVSTKVGVGGGDKVEFEEELKIKRLSLKSWFSLSPRPPEQSSNSSLICCCESWLFHFHRYLEW